MSNFDKNEYGGVYNIFEAIARDYNDNLDRKNLEKNSQINRDVFRKIKEESAKWAFVENDYKKDIDKLCKNILENANQALTVLSESRKDEDLN